MMKQHLDLLEGRGHAVFGHTIEEGDIIVDLCDTDNGQGIEYDEDDIIVSGGIEAVQEYGEDYIGNDEGEWIVE